MFTATKKSVACTRDYDPRSAQPGIPSISHMELRPPCRWANLPAVLWGSERALLSPARRSRKQKQKTGNNKNAIPPYALIIKVRRSHTACCLPGTSKQERERTSRDKIMTALLDRIAHEKNVRPNGVLKRQRKIHTC